MRNDLVFIPKNISFKYIVQLLCFVHQFFSVYKVTTGTKNFVSVILKLAAVPDLDNIHFLPHVTLSSALQLINGISNDLQIF